jgi:hypothetical protein
MKLRKTLILAFILPFVVALNACQQESDKNSISQEQPFYNSKTDAPSTTTDLESAPKNKDFTSGENKSDGTLKQINYQQPTENTNPQDKRMIIRTGTMSIENDSFDETELKAKEIAKNLGGFITNSTAQVNQSGKKQGTLTIRVQADKYDALLAELAKTGKVMSQNITGRDVTEEFVDAEARLKTQRELETRLLQLLAEKTANLTAVVEVEQKLANVRENIEKTEGRMRMLKDQASFSTITLSIYEPAILNTSSGGFFYELERGFEKGLTGFTKVLAGIITFVIAMAPILAILGFIVYIVIRFIKKRKVVKA